ncbi:MAG TPA: DinB family protein [Tepidisphaeraceae bacterium]|nr:DinB family protein [Tepidisphaeraceae bacterium]
MQSLPDIERFEAGGDALRAAVAGLSAEEMLAFPVPGTWSIHQIVVHMADSDAIGVHRMKRIVAEENPLLIGYDESKFTAELFYEAQSAEAALTLFDLNRREFAKVLRRLPAEAFGRVGCHNERGLIKLGETVDHYSEHLEHHLRFVYEKRKKLGR